MGRFFFQNLSILTLLLAGIAAVGVCPAAVVPYTAGNVSSKGFTRIDFCHGDQRLYAFNGLNLCAYDEAGDSFVSVFAGLGSVTDYQWDPADFAFLTDSNNTVLPTGQSMRVVYAELPGQSAEVKSGLSRNYYSAASRFRANEFYANGVGSVNNTIYLLDAAGAGSEVQVVEISNRNSGAIAFDSADNLYISDFAPLTDGSGLGLVNIYRISRSQLDSFIEDSNFVVSAQLLVRDVVLAGSDSMVIDSDYNIYMGSYCGIARIVPTNEPDDYNIIAIDGDIYANPHGFPWPEKRFCGITADLAGGVCYYGLSELDPVLYQYGPYQLYSFNITPRGNWPADLDGDGIVDSCDMALVFEDYLYSGDYLRGDINRDGIVDLKDFAELVLQFNDKAKWY